jgi:hypothetical protein
MKRIYSFMLAFLVLIPTLLKVAVIGNYWLNYERYSQELCENMDKPELSCNGKCQMMEELTQTERDSAPKAPSLPTFKVNELPAISAEILDFQVVLEVLHSYPKNKRNPAVLAGLMNDVFHPPCQVA